MLENIMMAISLKGRSFKYYSGGDYEEGSIIIVMVNIPTAPQTPSS